MNTDYPFDANIMNELFIMTDDEQCPDIILQRVSQYIHTGDVYIVCRLISDDDILVSGFLAELFARQLPDIRYLPMIAAIVHRELGERYPSGRMILYEQGIEDYAGLAVDLLLSALRGKEIPESRVVYRFKPVKLKDIK